MRQHKLADEYIDGLIPSGISRNVREEIISEFNTHIEERIEFFTERGMDDAQAEKRAIEEMGDGSDIRREFRHVYRMTLIPTILFPIIYAVLAVVTFFTGFVYFNVDWGNDPTAFTVAVSTCISLGIFYFMYRAYKRKNTLFLISAMLTCFFGGIIWLFTAGMHQHFLCGVTELFRPIVNLFENNEAVSDVLSDLTDYTIVFGSILLNLVYVILGIVWCRKCNIIKLYKNPPKRKKHSFGEKSLLGIFITAFILITGNFLVQNGFYSGSNTFADMVHNNVQAKISRKYFNTVDYSISYNDVEKLLLDNGFKKYPYTVLNKDVSSEFGYGEWEETPYYNSDGIEVVAFEKSEMGSKIYVSNTGDAPIAFKTLENCNPTDHRIALGLTRTLKPSEFIESLDKLELGMDCNAVQNNLDTNNADLNYIFSEKKNGAVYEKYYYSWDLFSIEDENYDAFYMPDSVAIFFKDGQLMGVMKYNGDNYTEFLGDKEQMKKISSDSNKGIYY